MSIEKSLRRHFPHTSKKVYFNAASNGPLPNPAFKIITDSNRIANMAAIGARKELFSSLDSIRRNASKIFGCRQSETGFGFNTTFGINLAAFGLPLGKDDEVLLVDVEFPANVYPWLELRNRGIKVKFIKTQNGFLNIDDLQKAITKKTKVVSISFVQFFNGHKNDLKKIGEICGKHKIYFVVDAIQGAGCEPLRVKDWGIDIASAGGQKWLLSPQGTGIFYASDRIQKIILPPWRSWLGVDWKANWSNFRNFNKSYVLGAQQYELGTYPVSLVNAIEWSLDFMLKNGIKNIQKHNHNLLDKLITYLKSEPYFQIASSLAQKHRSSILSFRDTGDKIEDIYKYLTRKSIITSLREGCIRVSVHLYNNESDMKTLISALRKCVPH
ncbi:MAG: aminotransferase class V-fold PLP-dependent enzyme [candidate division Zixibacteria bacterium]